MTKSLSNRFTRGLDAIVADDIGKCPIATSSNRWHESRAVQVHRGVVEDPSVSLRGLSATATGTYNSVALKF